MKIAILRDVKSPERGTTQSAGLDFFVPNDFIEMYLQPGESVNIPSGIYAKLPENTALIAMNKSGVAINYNLQVGACVIDEDYQGEMHLHVINIGLKDVIIRPGMKLIQLLCVPINYITPEVVSLDELYNVQTVRGAGAFGSTGGCAKHVFVYRTSFAKENTIHEHCKYCHAINPNYEKDIL